MFWAMLNSCSRVYHLLCPTHLRATNTRGDQAERSELRRIVRSKRTYKMKNVWGLYELGRFLVTGASDESGKPSHFYGRICRMDVSVLTHGVHESLHRFQGTKHFPRDQRLQLEPPGWRTLDFEGNPMKEEEIEWQRERILRAPQKVRDRDYLFSEDLIVDNSGAVDVSLPVLAKVSALIESLRLGGS